MLGSVTKHWRIDGLVYELSKHRCRDFSHRIYQLCLCLSIFDGRYYYSIHNGFPWTSSENADICPLPEYAETCREDNLQVVSDVGEGLNNRYRARVLYLICDVRCCSRHSVIGLSRQQTVIFDLNLCGTYTSVIIMAIDRWKKPQS